MILTGLGGFSTPAGHIGSEVEVGHDISMLVPEIWCRLRPEEREPATLQREGLLEKLSDFQHEGQTVLASRLGWRITGRFIRRYFGRVFDNPGKVFDDRILKPELQDFDAYVDGIHHIVEAQQKVARQYFEDGSIEAACPPLRALLSIMAHGNWEGHDSSSPEVRQMFTKEHLLGSQWYRDRLEAKRQVDIQLWERHVRYLTEYVSRRTHKAVIERLKLQDRLREAQSRLAFCRTDAYFERIQGTLGTQSRWS